MASSRQGIFICYRRDDSADVSARIYEALVQRFRRQMIFKDVDDIPIGLDFRHVIDDKLDSSSIVLVVIGEDWLAAKNDDGVRRLDDPGDHVRYEIQSALGKKIPVIPLLVHHAKHPSQAELPESIRDLHFRQGAEVRPDPHFARDVQALCDQLARTFQGLPKRAQAADRAAVAADSVPAPDRSAPSSATATSHAHEFSAWGFHFKWLMSSLLLFIPPLSAFVQHRLLRPHVGGSIRWFWVAGTSNLVAGITAVILSDIAREYYSSSSPNYSGHYYFNEDKIMLAGIAAGAIATIPQMLALRGWFRGWWLWLLAGALIWVAPMLVLLEINEPSKDIAFFTWAVGTALISAITTPFLMRFLLRCKKAAD